ncbi:ABC-type dipeptide/oligopeptide/nickel transport system permease subunit [Rhizobium leguminosarum]
MLTSRIIFHHLLPNSFAPANTLIPIEVGHAVAPEATLSFLGLRVPIDKPSLGSAVANGFQTVAVEIKYSDFTPSRSRPVVRKHG